MTTRGGPVRRYTRSGRLRLAVALTGAAALLVGCGSDQSNQSDQASPEATGDLCAQYDQLVDQVRSLEDIDPDTVTLDEVRSRVDGVQDQLDALEDAASGQLEAAIAEVRAAVDDLATAAADAGQKALAATEPLVGQTLDDLSEAWATLQLAADTRCGEG